MECPKCGSENANNAQFCSLCGLPFGELTDSAQMTGGVESPGLAPVSAQDSADEGWGAAPGILGAEEDPFAAERRAEQARYAARQRKIEEAGGSEVYDAQLRDRLEASKRKERTKTVIFHSVLLAVALVAGGFAVSAAVAWANAMAGAAGAVGTAAGSGAGGPSIGGAFGTAIGLLVVATVLGTSTARLGRKSMWGSLAVIAAIGVEAAYLVPYVSAGAGSPTGSGTAFGVAAFAIATAVGGFVGAWYGGREIV